MNSARLQALLGLFLFAGVFVPVYAAERAAADDPATSTARRLILQPNPNLKRTPFLSPLSRWWW